MKMKKTKTGRKIVSLLLAAAMLFTMQGIPALAETVCNDVAETVESVGREEPLNPVHNCTENDDTKWSYVYFGSYPQSEVTGDALTAAVTGASYDSNGDAWVDGTKYRRISKRDTNYDSYFGDSIYRYFKWERIKWRVLDVNGSTIFAVADKGLDCKNYNEESESVTWENCTLRNWLNNDFYGMAFSNNEQKAIVSQTVVNEDNSEYGTEGGNDTWDKVFLLSIGEVTNPKYGFCEDYDASSVSHRIQGSDYAYARGACIVTSGDYAGNCWWWLRSPGNNTSYAAYVRNGGYVNRYGYSVDDNSDACVPALHINLSSDLWSIADDGSSGTGGNGGEMTTPTSLMNPVHNCVKNAYTEWSYVYFGSYPQSEVTGGALTAAITGASYDSNGDAWVGNTKYRRIRNRYFKWERIKWRVLDVNGSTIFAAADKGLDCKNYYEEYKSITWENCTLRNWLNNDFYDTAFSSAEQAAIVSQTVVNEDNPKYGTEGGDDTWDNVFLLSIGEVTNPKYGFCEDYETYSVSRRIQASDYAHARGLITTDDAGNCDWWLRSPGSIACDAAFVRTNGDVYRFGNIVNDYYVACVPVLHINLSSDLWSMTDDGSSGSGGNGGTGGSGQKPDGGNSQESESQNLGSQKTSLTKSSVILQKISYIYDGKAKIPGVTVKIGTKKLVQNKDYKLTYQNNKKIGTASVTITGIGSYTGSLTKTFKIIPKGTAISGKPKAKSKGFTVTWKKQNSVTGYQIQYSTSKKFTKKTTVTKTVKKKSATKLTISKLKPNKKYYVRISTYQTIKGQKYESAWSKSKTVKTKK